MKKSLSGLLLVSALFLSYGCSQDALTQTAKDILDNAKKDAVSDSKDTKTEDKSSDTKTDETKTDTSKDDTKDGSAVVVKASAKASLDGAAESSCDQEKSLKSLNANEATKFTFKNSSDKTLKFYWLNYQGARVHYKDVKAGASYTQSTFVTHPWIITDESENCLGIYTPSKKDTSAITIDSVTLPSGTTSGSASTDTSVNLSVGSDTELRALTDCIISKNPLAQLVYNTQYEKYIEYKNNGQTAQATAMKNAIVITAQAAGCKN